jgi:hypothetical protein
MLSRRTASVGLASAAGVSFAACKGRDAYTAAAARTWRLLEAERGSFPARALVHAATLAANSHNTQPWQFTVENETVRIAPDFGRCTPVVDPDDHHLFASLGCAAETMIQAAPFYGWIGSLEAVDPVRGLELQFIRKDTADGSLARAIPLRASTRAEYDGRSVAVSELKRLDAVGGETAQTTLITDRARLEQATEFIVAGNAAQVRSPPFRRELKDWIRFNADEALRRGDGLFARSSGNPTMPRIIGEPMFELSFTVKGETDRIVRQMRSSAGLVVFSAHRDDPGGWVEAGRAYTRFALLATNTGLKTAFLNQPVEDASTRVAFSSWLNQSGKRADLVVRFGFGPDLPRSVRRPLDAVLVA